MKRLSEGVWGGLSLLSQEGAREYQSNVNGNEQRESKGLGELRGWFPIGWSQERVGVGGGGGRFEFEWVPTAKRLCGVEALNAKI